MKWEELSIPWQVSIQQAWMAYCAGSLPIGAAIATPDGQVVTEGRNRINDAAADGDPQHFREHFMAHAEQNAFVSLGVIRREQPTIKRAIKEYILYSTLEPCDMCVGTLIQSGMRGVQYLVPDPMGGAIDTLSATPHVRDKGITVQGPQPGILANVALAIFMVSMTQSGMVMPDAIITMMQPYADGLNLAKLLVESGELAQLQASNAPISTVYNRLVEQLNTL